MPSCLLNIYFLVENVRNEEKKEERTKWNENNNNKSHQSNKRNRISTNLIRMLICQHSFYFLSCFEVDAAYDRNEDDDDDDDNDDDGNDG